MDNSNAISREEHSEFEKRIEEENHRQNTRLSILEADVREIRKLTETVAQLAQAMKTMVKEQERQGQRLEKIEGRDGENWRSVVTAVITTVVGLLLGYVFAVAKSGGMG